MALPLGAVLCFFDLLGARAFSRGELALQRRFHAPLSIHRAPYHPHPIFTRYREPTTEELESSHRHPVRNGLIRENSFYKNTYAMVRSCDHRLDSPIHFSKIVHRSNVIPSTILFHRYQTFHHPFYHPRHHRIWRSSVSSRPPCPCRAACCSENWNLASECCG